MIKFGTDGWRAIIADEFTVQNVRYCAQGMAEYLLESGVASRGIVIGYDTRFASERFAPAAAEVMAANGIKVRLTSGATPTQVVSFGTLHFNAAGAIVITASHNPPEWNGFKIKTAGGASAPPEVEAEIEKRIPDIIAKNRVKSISLEQALEQGTIEYVDLYPIFAEQIAKLVDLEGIRQAGFKVVADPMFGAGSGYLKNIIGPAKTQVIEIHQERNPSFPGMKQPEPIASNLTELCQFIREQKADIGVATDGDADRVGIVDENGEPLTPLQIFGLLAFYLLEIQGERGALVKTVTTTGMINRLGELYNVPVFETKVGFKHVAPIMEKENALIGGEESSGFGYRGHIPERDGVLSGLLILDFMVKTKKSPSELVKYLYSKVGPHHYHRNDVEFPAEDREVIVGRLNDSMPKSIGGTEVVNANTIDGYHFRLADGSWLLMRFSGTEPLLRIYSEAESLDRAKALVSEGRKILQV
ncbi:MAG: phosphoglucomutase/phosphomannomutase family protein [Chloroflexi bacterium]|nr:phosphoglucomutase/phosphomannomutase family protein [Chloroflexota bacterium]